MSDNTIPQRVDMDTPLRDSINPMKLNFSAIVQSSAVSKLLGKPRGKQTKVIYNSIKSGPSIFALTGIDFTAGIKVLIKRYFYYVFMKIYSYKR